jgi:site-specific DNA recombinase
MTAVVAHGHRCFRCASHDRSLGVPRCAGTIRADVVEEQIWKAVMRVLSDPDVIRQEVLRQQAGSDQQQQDFRAERTVLANALGCYDEQDRRMVRGYAEGILTLEDLQRYRTEVQPAIDVLRRQLPDAEAREATLATQLGQLDALIGYCQQVRSTIRTFSLEERQLAFDALGLHVTYRQGQPLHIAVQLPVVSMSDAPA